MSQASPRERPRRPPVEQPLSVEEIDRLLTLGQPRTTREQVGGELKGAATGLYETGKGIAELGWRAISDPLGTAKELLYTTPVEAVKTGYRETQDIASRPPYPGQTREILSRAAATPFEMAGIPVTRVARDIGGGIADIVAERRYGVRPEEEGRLGRGLGTAAGVGAVTYGVGRATEPVRARIARGRAARPGATAQAGAQPPPPGPTPPGPTAPGAPPPPPAGPRVVEGEIVTEEMIPSPGPPPAEPPPPPRPRFVAPEGNVPPNFIINGKRVKELIWDPKMIRHRLIFEDGTAALIDHARLARESQRQWVRGPARQTAERPPVEPEEAPPGGPPPPPPEPTAARPVRPPIRPPVTRPPRPTSPPITEPPIVEPEVPVSAAAGGLPPSEARIGKTTKRGGEGYPQIPIEDVTDVERVELGKMLVGMESSEFTPRTWNWDPSGAGAATIVGGGAGHPVYWDIVGGSPDRPNPTYPYSRKEVETKLRDFLTTGKRNVVSDLALDRLRSGQGHAAESVPAEYTEHYVNVPREMRRPPPAAAPGGPPTFEETTQVPPADTGAMQTELAAMPDAELEGWVRMLEPLEGEALDPASQDALALARTELARRRGEPPPGPAVPPEVPQLPAAGEAAPRLTFEEFQRAYTDAFRSMMRYTPDQVGSQTFSDRMAALADEYPEWAAQVEAEGGPPAGPAAPPPEAVAETPPAVAPEIGTPESFAARVARDRAERVAAAGPGPATFRVSSAGMARGYFKVINEQTGEVVRSGLKPKSIAQDIAKTLTYEANRAAAAPEAAAVAPEQAPPVAPSPPPDLLPTGEMQPRIPGAEAVREQEIPTPEFEAPFSLNPEAAEGGGVQESLLSRFIKEEEGTWYPFGPPQQDIPLPGMDMLDKARAAENHKPYLTQAKEAATNFMRDYYDQHLDVRRMVDDMRRRGVQVPPDADTGVLIDLVAGGTLGPIQAAMLDILDIRKGAARDGLQTLVTRYLDNRGWERGLTIVEEHMQEEFAKAQAAQQQGNHQAAQAHFREVARIQQRLAAKEVVPLRKGHPELAADLAALQAHPQFPQIKAYADQLHALNGRYWEMAHQPGRFGESLISDQVYQQGIARGPEYVPLERILDIVDHDPDWIGGAGLDLKKRSFLQKLEGSQLATRDPWEASWLHQSRIIKELGRNEVGASVANWRTLDPNGLGQVVIPLHGSMKPPAGYDRIGYYLGGQKQTLAVPSELANSLRLAGPHNVRLVGETALGFGKTMLHVGAVGANIAFAAPNIVRDILDVRDVANVVDFYGLPPQYAHAAKVWVSSLYHVLKQDQVYREVLRARALYGTITKQIDPKLQLRFDRPLRSYLNPVTALKTIVSASDETTKVTGYRLLREPPRNVFVQGQPVTTPRMSEVAAAHETRTYVGTPDAARGGRKADMANQLLMFFKVNVQGAGRVLQRYWNHPGRAAAILAESTLAALALYEWNSQFRDDDGELAVDKIPREEREQYWPIVTPYEYTASNGEPTHWSFKVPKNHVRQMLSNPIEKTIALALGSKAEDDLGQIALDTATGPLPGNIRLEKGDFARSLGLSFLANTNPAIGLPIDVGLNVDPYRRVPLVPQREAEVANIEQYGPTTSPAAIAAGRATGLSPRHIEYGVRRGAGGLGDQALQLADIALTGRPRNAMMPLEGPEALTRQIPIAGAILSRFLVSPRNALLGKQEDRFFKLLEQSREVVRTYNYRSQAAEPGPQQAEAYIDADPTRRILYDASRELNSISQQLSDIRAETALIVADQATPGPQKLEQIRLLRQDYKEILQSVDDIVNEMNASSTPPPSAPIAPPPQGPPALR